MKTFSLVLLTLLAACGAGDEPPAVPADSGAAPPVAAPAVPTPAPVEAAPAEAGSQAGSEPLPTRADSVAGAREDVSPEWKMRERGMASYAQCMQQAQVVEGEARAAIARACANLPDAPR